MIKKWIDANAKDYELRSYVTGLRKSRIFISVWKAKGVNKEWIKEGSRKHLSQKVKLPKELPSRHLLVVPWNSKLSPYFLLSVSSHVQRSMFLHFLHTYVLVEKDFFRRKPRHCTSIFSSRISENFNNKQSFCRTGEWHSAVYE